MADAIRETVGVDGMAAVPLGALSSPIKANSTEMLVLKQCARDYVTAGRNRGSLHNMNNVTLMYYNVMQVRAQSHCEALWTDELMSRCPCVPTEYRV
jgi:hypothetical protein